MTGPTMALVEYLRKVRLEPNESFLLQLQRWGGYLTPGCIQLVFGVAVMTKGSILIPSLHIAWSNWPWFPPHETASSDRMGPGLSNYSLMSAVGAPGTRR